MRITTPMIIAAALIAGSISSHVSAQSPNGNHGQRGDNTATEDHRQYLFDRGYTRVSESGGPEHTHLNCRRANRATTYVVENSAGQRGSVDVCRTPLGSMLLTQHGDAPFVRPRP